MTAQDPASSKNTSGAGHGAVAASNSGRSIRNSAAKSQAKKAAGNSVNGSTAGQNNQQSSSGTAPRPGSSSGPSRESNSETKPRPSPGDFGSFSLIHDIKELRVFKDPKTWAPDEDWPAIDEWIRGNLSQSDETFKEMKSCIIRAMAILTLERRCDLEEYSRKLISYRNNASPKLPHLYPFADLKHVPGYVSGFLARLRWYFPDVFISGLKKADGTTETATYWGSSIAEYVPKAAARIMIHAKTWENLMYQKNQIAALKKELQRDVPSQGAEAQAKRKADLLQLQQRINITQLNYERSHFHVVVTLAHELFHVLTGFWTGTDRPGTPPDLYGGRHGNDERGEAGWWWEIRHMFKGEIHFYYDTTDPLGPKQSGIPYMEDHEAETFTRVSDAYVRDIYSKGKSYHPKFDANCSPIPKANFRMKNMVRYLNGDYSSNASSSETQRAARRATRAVGSSNSRGIFPAIKLSAEQLSTRPNIPVATRA